MENYKKKISQLLTEVLNVDEEKIYNNIALIKEQDKGDYTFPCFFLSKELRKAPNLISEELKSKINNPDYIERIETVNGYLNFFIKKEVLTKEVFEEFNNKKVKNSMK